MPPGLVGGSRSKWNLGAPRRPPRALTPMPMLPELLVETIAGADGVTVLPPGKPTTTSPSETTWSRSAWARSRAWSCATRQGPQPEHVRVLSTSSQSTWPSSSDLGDIDRIAAVVERGGHNVQIN